jgi:Flp pilus assembly protein TadB
MKTMKAFVLGSAATFGLALAIYAQTPAATPETTTPSPVVAATATPAVSVSPAISATPSAANQFADKIKERVDRKFKHKGFGITVDGRDGEERDSDRHHGDDGIPGTVLPIAIISVLAVFGFPVAIVAVIMFSSWARTRSLHRTVRMMVEKGQPVPPELLSSPAAAPVTVRPWYDLRRGIVLVSVGVGVIMFFGISAGWDNGVWALGLIPGLIGLGYLLAWRLAYRDEKALKQ